MSLFTYTGKLSDIGLGALTEHFPAMHVAPEREAFGPSGTLISAVPESVALGTDGSFLMHLVPSGELGGVRYRLTVGRFEDTIDGHVFHGTDVWSFTAVAGGGDVAEMEGGSMLAVWVGPPWPPAMPDGFYIDVATSDWGVKGI